MRVGNIDGGRYFGRERWGAKREKSSKRGMDNRGGREA